MCAHDANLLGIENLKNHKKIIKNVENRVILYQSVKKITRMRDKKNLTLCRPVKNSYKEYFLYPTKNIFYPTKNIFSFLQRIFCSYKEYFFIPTKNLYFLQRIFFHSYKESIFLQRII